MIKYNESFGYDSYSNKDNSNKLKKKNSGYIYEVKVSKEFSYKGELIDIDLESKCEDKYINVQMDLVSYVRIYGTVKKCNGDVVKNTKLTIFRSELINYKTEYIAICDTFTDENGIYDVVTNNIYEDNHYIVRVAADE